MIAAERLIEIAVDSAPDGRAAAEAGAHRLELCASLDLHGLTPATAELKRLKERVTAPVIALVRPTPAGFAYPDSEWRRLRDQAAGLLDAGADGVAFGCLTAEGAIDAARCREIARLCGPRDAVFHRAFDLVADSGEALESLIDAGVRRVLSAAMGPAETAGILGLAPVIPPEPLEQRLPRLRRLVTHARGRIEILACGGVRPINAARFVTDGGCTQLHSACRAPGAAAADPAMVRDLVRAASPP